MLSGVCFLVIGIDDMFILMFGMVGVLFLLKVLIEDRMKSMLRMSGILIIIMLVIDFFVFGVGVILVF